MIIDINRTYVNSNAIGILYPVFPFFDEGFELRLSVSGELLEVLYKKKGDADKKHAEILEAMINCD